MAPKKDSKQDRWSVSEAGLILTDKEGNTQTLKMAHWTDPTHDAMGRIYNITHDDLEDLGDDVVYEAVSAFCVALGKDKDKISGALKTASDAAQRAQREAEILKMREILDAYNEPNGEDLLALGQRLISLKVELAEAEASRDAHKLAASEALKEAGYNVTPLQVAFLGDAGKIHVSFETLKESKKGKGKGGGSRLKRDWSEGHWSVSKPNALKGVDGPILCEASVSDVDLDTGKGKWIVKMTPPSGKVYQSTPGCDTINAASKSAIGMMIVGEDDTVTEAPPINWNAPSEFGVPVMGQAVSNVSK